MKVKLCRYCGKELTENDSKNRPQCFDCSWKRHHRWSELQAEAKRKFDEEWKHE